MNQKTAYQQLREELGLTQQEFGSAMGVTRQRIGQIENRQGILSPEKLLPLMKLHRRSIRMLGLSIEDFLGGSR